MKKSLKIFAVGILLTVLIVGFALLRFCISSLGPPSLMSLNFLDGRAVTVNIEYDPRKPPLVVTAASGPPYCSWIQYYSFEADFGDLCKAADAELLALGFKTHKASTKRQSLRAYSLSKATSSKTVVIYDRRRFIKSPSGQLPQPSDADGWVTVKISRGRLPFWPPRYLLYRLKRFSQVTVGR